MQLPTISLHQGKKIPIGGKVAGKSIKIGIPGKENGLDANISGNNRGIISQRGNSW